MSAVQFDWTFGIGHIFTALSVIWSLAWYLSRNIAKYVRSVDNLRVDVSELAAKVAELHDLRSAFGAVEKTNDDQTREIARFSAELRTMDTRGQILERTVDRLEKRMDSLDKEVLRARENIHDLRGSIMMVFAKTQLVADQQQQTG